MHGATMKIILVRFKLKLQSCSYQILDYTFLHSAQYPHVVDNRCGRKSSAFQESVAFFQIGLFSFPTRTVTDLVYPNTSEDILMPILEE